MLENAWHVWKQADKLTRDKRTTQKVAWSVYRGCGELRLRNFNVRHGELQAYSGGCVGERVATPAAASKMPTGWPCIARLPKWKTKHNMPNCALPVNRSMLKTADRSSRSLGVPSASIAPRERSPRGGTKDYLPGAGATGAPTGAFSLAFIFNTRS